MIATLYEHADWTIRLTESVDIIGKNRSELDDSFIVTDFNPYRDLELEFDASAVEIGDNAKNITHFYKEAPLKMQFVKQWYHIDIIITETSYELLVDDESIISAEIDPAWINFDLNYFIIVTFHDGSSRFDNVIISELRTGISSLSPWGYIIIGASLGALVITVGWSRAKKN